MNREEYIQALSTYLGHDCNLAATASTLYTHRHTVRYRLDRIRSGAHELTEIDVVDAFPRNGTGKIMKHVMRRAAAEGFEA